jgi:predicted enzyme related to lactoylglutathione lyase
MATRTATKKSTRKPAKRTTARRATAKRATKAPAKRAVAPARAKGPRVGWWEITLPDKASSDSVKKFMTTVFGWKISSDPQYDYGQVSDKDAGIGGGIGPSQQGMRTLTFYIEVPNIPAYLKKIEAAGGRTVMPETSAGTTKFALFTDPAGNTIGLYKGMGGAD